MDLGESIAVLDTLSFECPFAHDSPGKVKNHLSGSGDRLGKRMAAGHGTRRWKQQGSQIVEDDAIASAPPCPMDEDCPQGTVAVTLSLDAEPEFPFSVAAHHLIPWDASLQKSRILEFLKEGSKVEGDVGYDVDGAENGVWLPTHHKMSQRMAKGAIKLPGEQGAVRYGDISDEGNQSAAALVKLYTYALMDKTKRQMHDAHGEYNEFVKHQLDKIHLNLAVTSRVRCPKCKTARANSGRLPPPHLLVQRLNAVSQRLKQHLLGSPFSVACPAVHFPARKDVCTGRARVPRAQRLTRS